MRRVDHRHLRFFFFRQGKELARLALDILQQTGVDAVVNHIEKTDIARGVAQMIEKRGAIGRACIESREIENWQGRG